MNLKQIGEFGFIRRLARRLPKNPRVLRAIGEDAAVLPYTSKEYLLFTADMLVEGVHFDLKQATPFQIGWKALAVNLSDIASMAGTPQWAVVSLGLPNVSVKFCDELYRGMAQLARKFKTSLVGGDTNRSKVLVISVALLGTVPKLHVCFRSGARVGDWIFVTGRLGGSQKGKHLSFIPRVREAQRLVQSFKIHSMMDISDGLASDLNRLCEESRVGARVEAERIPLSPGVKSFCQGVSEGEDFELLFTTDPREGRRLLKEGRHKIGLPVSRVGQILQKRRGMILLAEGEEIQLKGGYHHF